MVKKKPRKKHPNRPKTTLKRDERLLKARQWLPTYQGTKIVKAYRKRFYVDVPSAVRDLQEIGYKFKPGYVDNLLKSEAIRLEQLRAQKEERSQPAYYDNPDQDDTFFYIAGYTSGGAPYGVTWEEEITPDNGLIAEFDRIVALFNDELKADGLELTTFADSLFVAETERLIIRRFYEFELESLWAGIMRKPEVMYAWEAGFNKKEVRKWLNHQLARYRNDGYGYFAVTLRRGGKLIGQAGLMKTEINGDEVTEIGYIFNNKYWGHGYATEAASACVDLAFNRFGLDIVYTTIRPENIASVKVAERLGMRKTGQHVKVYQGKEMLHDIYMLEK